MDPSDASVDLRQIHVPAIWKLTAIAKADTLTAQRDSARARARRVTRTLSDLREATRPGLRVLGVRLPGWADDVVLGIGAAGLGYGVGKAVGESGGASPER